MVGGRRGRGDAGGFRNMKNCLISANVKETKKEFVKCCRLNQSEDEKHFLCICPLYDPERYLFQIHKKI